MVQSNAFRFRSLVLLTTIPAILVGGALWVLGSMVPACRVDEQARLTSPGSEFDLLVFTRACGETPAPNTQAALLPVGDALPDDAASFLIIGTAVDVTARWTGAASLDITIPAGADIMRHDDQVAGVAVTYR